MKKNAVAIILALCMVIAMLPMTAQAAAIQQPLTKTAPAQLPDAGLELTALEPNAKSYSVSLSGGSHGTTELLVDSPAKVGSEVYFAADPDEGYIAQIRIAGVDPDEVFYMGMDMWGFIMPANKVTIEVSYEKLPGETHSVSVHTGGRGQYELSQISAREGESVYLAVLPRDASDFDPLTHVIASEGELYYLFEDEGIHYYELFMPDDHVHIFVQYSRTGPHRIEVWTNPGECTVTAPENAMFLDEVTATIVPNPGYRIVRVAIEAYAGSLFQELTPVAPNTYKFIMFPESTNIHVTCEAIINPVSVTVDTGLGGTASLDCTEAQAGKTVTLTCVPEEGYRVAQITGADLTDNGDNTYSFTMPDRAVDLHVLFLRENNPFLDVNETHFFYDPVLWAVEQGITNGIDETHFGPYLNSNRAAAVTMLWRYAGSPEPNTTVNPFKDVPAGCWYEAPVLWAVENGITNGVSPTEFGPTMTCNRAQVVTFLYRFWNACAPEGVANPFEDVPAGSWFEAPVLWALEHGITTGSDATHFGPTGDCLRAQFVTFLYRAKDIAFYHNVEAAADETMGAISLSHATAQAGTVVTATVTPNEGYLVESVACLSGAEVTQVSDTEYTFVMPDEDEILQVNFAPIPAEPDPSEPTDPTEPEEPTDPEEPGRTYELVLKTNGPGIVRYVDKNFAAPGESIFFYAIPNEGCYLSRVSILNPNNEIDESKIQLFAHEGDLYELVMIDHQMVLTFHFMPLPG